jgi:hypothetical protein
MPLAGREGDNVRGHTSLDGRHTRGPVGESKHSDGGRGQHEGKRPDLPLKLRSSGPNGSASTRLAPVPRPLLVIPQGVWCDLRGHTKQIGRGPTIRQTSKPTQPHKRNKKHTRTRQQKKGKNKHTANTEHQKSAHTDTTHRTPAPDTSTKGTQAATHGKSKHTGVPLIPLTCDPCSRVAVSRPEYMHGYAGGVALTRALGLPMAGNKNMRHHQEGGTRMPFIICIYLLSDGHLHC